MTPMEKKGARFGLALLGAAALLAPGAAGAVQPAYGAVAETPGDALSRNLKVIAETPHNVGALIGAGKAALELGDPQAALTFFARAEQDAPQDGWVKKWMGSALVQLEQPAAALKFFRDAAALGVPDASLAGDRGLAWDISGDPRRAQRDYRLALSGGGDPEIVRRLALSLAISGEREPALRLLADQLYQRDRAALRTRALVLALTGDAAGADRAVETAMPGAQGAALEPFLARLPSLSLADRALAVHLGHFPGNGAAGGPAQTYARNGYGAGLPAGYTPTPNAGSAPQRDRYASLDAGRPDESRPAFGSVLQDQDEEQDSSEGRRIPGVQPQAASPARSAPVRAGRSQPPTSAMPQWSWSRGELGAPRRAAQTATQSAHPPQPAQARKPEPEKEVELAEADPPAAAPVTLPESRAPAPRQSEPALVPPSQPAQHSRLAEVAAALDRIEDQQRRRSVRSAAASEDAAETKPSPRTRTAAASKPAKKAPPPPREPSRHWVQVAGGADKETLPRAFARLKEKAPKLFTGRAAWTVPNNATNRLLVGPFDSADDAQDFVNKLAKADLSGFAWTSEAGQKIEKLAGR
jgi:Flp pilus assembly protein TadD